MADDLEFTIPDQTFREVGAAAARLRILIHNEKTKATMVFVPTMQATGQRKAPTWRGQPVGRTWRGQPV